jgi:hypothetical protein
VQAKIKDFDSVEVVHVPREQKTKADILSKLASTRMTNGNKTVIQEVFTEPSVQRKKKTAYMKSMRSLRSKIGRDLYFAISPAENYPQILMRGTQVHRRDKKRSIPKGSRAKIKNSSLTQQKSHQTRI